MDRKNLRYCTDNMMPTRHFTQRSTDRSTHLKRLLTALIATLWMQTATAELHISDAYVRGLPPGQTTTAAYLSIRNSGTQATQIVAASSDAAKRTEIHSHSHSGGVMKMRKVESITVSPGQTFDLSPGGHHIMLIGLHKPLRDGETVSITLKTADGESISATFPVKSVLKE